MIWFSTFYRVLKSKLVYKKTDGRLLIVSTAVVLITPSILVITPLLLNNDGELTLWFMLLLSFVIGISIFISMRKSQSQQPNFININELGVLRVDNADSTYAITQGARVTPWFILLTLKKTTDDSKKRLLLWARCMSDQDYRALGRTVRIVIAAR